MFDVALERYGEPSGLACQEMWHRVGAGPTAIFLRSFVEPYGGQHQSTHMIELVAADQQLKFGRDNLTPPQYCLDCDVRFTCRLPDRFIDTPTATDRTTVRRHQLFFHHIDQPAIVVRLLRQNRAPAEVMQLYADQDQKWQALLAKTGRNDPCPCGSGKKFKNCHGHDRS
jgi:hypothetical protein